MPSFADRMVSFRFRPPSPRTTQPGRLRHLTLLSAVLLIACGESEPNALGPAPGENSPEDSPALLTFQEGHMGAQFTIRTWAVPSRQEAAKEAVAAAFERIHTLEKIFSDYLVDSEIARLTAIRAGEAVAISPDLFHVLDRAETLSRETDGAFDVTIGPMVRLWRQARKNHRLPTPERVTQARERTGWQKLVLDRETPALTMEADSMQFDFGGIAKGYAADAAMAILQQRGFPQSLVAASGDIVVGDPPPGDEHWKVGIRSLDVVLAGDPDRKLTGSIPLTNGAISTSGDTQQAITLDDVRYSHIVDPETALGLTERIAVTVIGPDTTTTDSYATAVSVLGKERGLAFIEGKEGVECLILQADAEGEITETRSSGFPEVQPVGERP